MQFITPRRAKRTLADHERALSQGYARLLLGLALLALLVSAMEAQAQTDPPPFTIDDPNQTASLSWDASLTRVFDDGTLQSPPCDDANNVQATEIVLGTLLGDDAFLPVELVSFDGVADGSDVVLRWSTASETNNAGFNIERRTDEVAGKPGVVSWETVS